jgi:predicted nucleotidyltransferase
MSEIMEVRNEREEEIIATAVRDKIKVCWRFGSFVKHKNNCNSDFDIALVLKDKKDMALVEKELSGVKGLDTTYFEENEAVERANFNDYLLGSLLEDEKYLYGDEKFLEEVKNLTFSKKPDANSVKFNLLEALQCYDTASLTFHNFKYFIRSAYKNIFPPVEEYRKAVLKDKFRIKLPECDSKEVKMAFDYAVQTLTNCEFALGYLYAGRMMEELNRTVVFSDLKDKNSLFNYIHSINKKFKNNKEVDVNSVAKAFYATYNEFGGWR